MDTPENLKKEIGEGDVVEMVLSDPEKNQELVDELEKLDEIIAVLEVDGQVNIRAMNAVAKLPRIMEQVEGVGVRIADLSVRQNTLEDVFIELTGTGLRE